MGSLEDCCGHRLPAHGFALVPNRNALLLIFETRLSLGCSQIFISMNPPPPQSLPPTTSDDKIWVILCHLSLLLGFGFVLPLIVYFVKKQDAPLTAEHAKEALNFHISVYIYGFVAVLLCFILVGFLLVPAVVIASVVLAIIACMKASEGGFYRYPLTLRFI